MASTCPKCHRVLEEDEVCCAQVRYSWRCTRCFKFDSGFIIPYGPCFLCGGKFEVIPDRELGDGMQFLPIRDALQFELDCFRFYRAASEEVSGPEQRSVLEHLYENGLDHLRELEERYHAHLDREMVDFFLDEAHVAANWPFRGFHVEPDIGPAEWYQLALAVERRARQHFWQLASLFPKGIEHELCRELAAEEDEYIAALETELEQLGQPDALRCRSDDQDVGAG